MDLGSSRLPLAVEGPKKWNALHLTAINYPSQATRADRERGRRALWRIVTTLSCPNCVRHATSYFARFPPDLSGSEGLQIWVWRFHNSVNARLGKKLVPFEEYQDMYREDIERARVDDLSY